MKTRLKPSGDEVTTRSFVTRSPAAKRTIVLSDVVQTVLDGFKGGFSTKETGGFVLTRRMQNTW
jgi:hypothetical protein